MSTLQTKLSLLEQTVRLEEEERQREEEERCKRLEKKEKEDEVKNLANDQLRTEMALQTEEAKRKKLIDEVESDRTVPRSVVNLMKEQSGKLLLLSVRPSVCLFFNRLSAVFIKCFDL